MNTPTKIYAKSRLASAANKELREKGAFDNYDDAVSAAADYMISDLVLLTDVHQTAGQLFELWLEMGEEVTIVPNDMSFPFIAEDFARLIVMQLTLDYSHPLYLEVTCGDALRFPSGGVSPRKQWVFWVKAPVTYQGERARPMLRRGVEALYEEMSAKARAADGSSYVLLDMSVREFNEADALEGMKTGAASTLYHIQNDGALRLTPQAVPQQVA